MNDLHTVAADLLLRSLQVYLQKVARAEKAIASKRTEIASLDAYLSEDQSNADALIATLKEHFDISDPVEKASQLGELWQVCP